MQSEIFAGSLLKPEQPAPAGFRGKSEKRFAVYRNNVVVGLTRAIESNFPLVRRMLGDVYFAGLAREFTLAHPPQQPLMFRYGDVFPEFLKAQEDLASYPYLPDVARIEIALREAHHAADGNVLQPDSLQTIVPDKLLDTIFPKHPATQLLLLEHSAATIAAAARLGQDDGLKLEQIASEGALITRPEFEARLTPLTLAQHDFAASLFEGHSPAEAFEAGASQDPEFDFSGALAILLSAGAFGEMPS